MPTALDERDGREASKGRETVMSTFTQNPDALGTNVLSVALIGPDEIGRKAMARALNGPQANVTRELGAYPDLDDLPRLLESGYDIIVVELDSNPEHALDLVEYICGSDSATVMVYSAHSDSEMLVRCMRAGAREYLIQPISASAMAEALVRASVRRPAVRAPKKVGGKVLVFAGTKGGSGTTTIAANFAAALAQESNRPTALIDLGFPLGNAALDLGLTTQHSTASALQNADRLDSTFLSRLLTRHSSGLCVLAAPDRYSAAVVPEESINKLISVSRQDFDYVVIDAGSAAGANYRTLFEAATTVYLVSQVSIPELRNANRLITAFFAKDSSHLEVVLNRYAARLAGIDEENITKALTLDAKWKVPGDYPAVRRAQNTASALVDTDSPISRVIRQMARTACGLPPEKKKKGFLF
jgi:pilus assembly protein CpaE